MKIHKSFVAVLMAMVSMLGMAETATVDGLLWQYSVSEDKATIEKLLTPGVENVVIPSEINGAKVTTIGGGAFRDDTYEGSTIRSVVIPEGVSVIGENAFYGCRKLQDAKLPTTLKRIGTRAFYFSSLRYARLPAGLELIGEYAFAACDGILEVEGSAFEIQQGALTQSGFCEVKFLDHVPSSILNTALFTSEDTMISYPKKYAEEWRAVVMPEKFAGYVPENNCTVAVLSKLRENVPTIMDVKVTPVSTKAEVKIRPVAFRNGINSFGNVVKVKTFVDGTGSVVQNPVKANQENVFSWNVAADLTDRVAKLKMDVMCVEDEVIPLELVSIPASSGHVAMTISRNVISPARIRDGLMWLLASPSGTVNVNVTEYDRIGAEFTLLKGETVVDSICGLMSSGFVVDFKAAQNGYEDLLMCRKSKVKKFVLEELGYTILEGDDLEYARKMTGLKLENGPYVKMK